MQEVTKTDRVYLSDNLANSPGFAVLGTRGLPARVDVLKRPAEQRFYDFTALAEATNLSTIDGVSEPVVIAGHQCSWMEAINYRPPGNEILVGADTGKVWFLNVEKNEVFFVNSGVVEFEACLGAIAEFYRAQRPADADRAAFPALVMHIIDTDPPLASLPEAFWHEDLEGLAIDVGLAFEFPWQ